MSEIIKKEFLNINEEENWLNKQGENNLVLVACNNGEYAFENGDEEYVYKIEILSEVIENTHFKNKDEYLKFLNERNIDVVSECEDKIYLRRKKSETQPKKAKKIVKAVNNASSKKSSMKGTVYYILGASQFGLALKFVLDTINTFGSMGSKFLISLLLSVVFIISGCVFMIAGVQLGRRDKE